MTLTPLYYAWKFYLACTLKPLEIKKVISIYNEKFYTLSSLLLGTCFFVICIVIYCFTVLSRILYEVVEDRTFTFRIITQSQRLLRFWLYLKYPCLKDGSMLYIYLIEACTSRGCFIIHVSSSPGPSRHLQERLPSVNSVIWESQRISWWVKLRGLY